MLFSLILKFVVGFCKKLVHHMDNYVARTSCPFATSKIHISNYLRECYREGSHVRKRQIANLSHCDTREAAAIELALKYKGDLAARWIRWIRFGCARTPRWGPSGPSMASRRVGSFDAPVSGVQHGGSRYVLRWIPLWAAQLVGCRADKQARLELLLQQRNRNLAEYPRVRVATTEKVLPAKIAYLKGEHWPGVEVEGRSLRVTMKLTALEEFARLDGCYVVETDLPPSAASRQMVQER